MEELTRLSLLFPLIEMSREGTWRREGKELGRDIVCEFSKTMKY
jgi:hypothetical protein